MINKPVNILLVTIHHTGTRFFLRLLTNALGQKWRGVGNQAIEKGRPELCELFCPIAACHLEPENMIYIPRYIQYHKPLILTTDRNREDTAASWHRRSRHSPDMLECCYHIQDWFRWKYEPFALSVDADDRESRLQNLSKMLGVKLVTNWEAVGSSLN